MAYVIKSKRPVKRCRRGKNNNSGCSMNFKNLGIQGMINFQLGSNIKITNQILLFSIGFILLSLGLALVLLYYQVNIHPQQLMGAIGYDQLIIPFFFCVTKSKQPRLTKQALEAVSEFHEGRKKNKQRNFKIRRRDITRFLDKCERDRAALAQARIEIKALRSANRWLKMRCIYLIIKKKIVLLLSPIVMLLLVPLKIVKQIITFLLFRIIISSILTYNHLKKVLRTN